jgi:hypothetical protein
MSFLFGGAPPSTSELARRYKLAICRAVRDIDREMAQIREQERVCMREIQGYASTNHAITMQKARAVVRSRKMQARFSNMKGQLQEIGSRILHIRSVEALEGALSSANRVISGFNARIGDRAMMKTLREFVQNNARMGTQTEMAEESLDTMFDEETVAGDEEEADDIVMSVLAEAGVRLPSTASVAAAATPMAATAVRSGVKQALPMIAERALSTSELEQRLLRLKPSGY